jgi:hypothetical protein
MTKSILLQYRKDFEEYFTSKSISLIIGKKFLSSFNQHVEENTRSFSDFWRFIITNRNLPVDESMKNLNEILSSKGKGFKTFTFVIEWSHSYLGPAEIMCLLLFGNSYSGGKRYPDILFNESDRRIEVKSYADNFRLTEATSFFTDLGTIIQALVQGGFLTSLTDINNNDIRKGLRHFCESFLCPRGYIELNSKIWKLESKDEETIVFKISSETSRDVVSYSVVRNSLRNWLGRGMLSIKLAGIIDPTRTTRIQKKELTEYVNNVLGIGNLIPIPLEQYFILCGLESMIIYEKKDKKTPFQIYKNKDLKEFTLDRIGQAKVSYKKLRPKSR